MMCGTKKIFTIKSDLNAISAVAEEILAVLKEKGVSDNCLHDIKLATEEAIINAMKHGNKFKPELPVVITFENEADKVVISVEDKGKGYDYIKVPDPTLGKNVEKGHGRGVFLIRRLMDEVHFNKAGNKIEMVKYLK